MGVLATAVQADFGHTLLTTDGVLWCARCGAYSQTRVGLLQQKCKGGASTNGKQYLRMLRNGILPGPRGVRLQGPTRPVNVQSWTPGARPVLVPRQEAGTTAAAATGAAPVAWKVALATALNMVGLPPVPGLLDG